MERYMTKDTHLGVFFIWVINVMYKERIGDKIYQTTAWRKLRQSYYTSKHGLCERCNTPGDIVHHKIHITKENVDDPYITLNAENLELLCHDCHNKEHKLIHEPIREGFTFDETGQLIKATQPPYKG